MNRPIKFSAWDKVSLISAFKSMMKKLGRQPTKKEWVLCKETPSDMPVRINFGNWGNFLAEMSLNALKVNPPGKKAGSKNKKGVKRIKTVHGYIHVFKPGHPFAMKNGYVREHRMIAYDAGILKDLSLEVHHKNGIKIDNRLCNLEIMKKKEHTSITWKGVKRSESGKPCKLCEIKTRSKYGLCSKHYRSAWAKSNKFENPELLEIS